MKKKLLILLIAVIPTLMPNLAFAVGIDLGDLCLGPNSDMLVLCGPFWLYKGLKGLLYEKETASTTDCCNSNVDAEPSICDYD